MIFLEDNMSSVVVLFTMEMVVSCRILFMISLMVKLRRIVLEWNIVTLSLPLAYPDRKLLIRLTNKVDSKVTLTIVVIIAIVVTVGLSLLTRWLHGT